MESMELFANEYICSENHFFLGCRTSRVTRSEIAFAGGDFYKADFVACCDGDGGGSLGLIGGRASERAEGRKIVGPIS